MACWLFFMIFFIKEIHYVSAMSSGTTCDSVNEFLLPVNFYHTSGSSYLSLPRCGIGEWLLIGSGIGLWSWFVVVSVNVSAGVIVAMGRGSVSIVHG